MNTSNCIFVIWVYIETTVTLNIDTTAHSIQHSNALIFWFNWISFCHTEIDIVLESNLFYVLRNSRFTNAFKCQKRQYSMWINFHRAKAKDLNEFQSSRIEILFVWHCTAVVQCVLSARPGTNSCFFCFFFSRYFFHFNSYRQERHIR